MSALPAGPLPQVATRRCTRRADGVPAQLARLLAADRPEDYRRAFYAFAVVLVTFFALTVLQGPCLQLYYGHDDIGFLATAWKVRNGSLPHADFHSSLGALNPWIFAAGMWLLGPSASVLSFCSAFVAAALGLVAWTVAARRLPAALAAGFAATQFVLALSPHLLRFEWFAATYDGYYNRQCYALVDTLLLLLFLPRRVGVDARTSRRDGLLAGGLLGTLFFMKVSYFMVAACLCGAALVLFRRAGRRLPWELAAGFGVVFLLCLPLIRFNLGAMLADLHLAAAVRPAAEGEAAFSVGVYLQRFCEAWIEVGLLAVIQSFLRPDWWHSRGAVPSWAEFACVAGASALLCTGNSAAGLHSETPLLASWMFVLLGALVRAPTVGTDRPRVTLGMRRRTVVAPVSGLAA